MIAQVSECGSLVFDGFIELAKNVAGEFSQLLFIVEISGVVGQKMVEQDIDDRSRVEPVIFPVVVPCKIYCRMIIGESVDFTVQNVNLKINIKIFLIYLHMSKNFFIFA